jgi:hypothetical protein
MLIDISEADANQVRKSGYRVAEGSLDRLYMVPPTPKLIPPPESGRCVVSWSRKCRSFRWPRLLRLFSI